MNQQQWYFSLYQIQLDSISNLNTEQFHCSSFQSNLKNFSNRINPLINKMGSYIIKKVTPQEVCSQNKFSIINRSQQSEISRANFRFLQRLTVNGYNEQQVVWIAQNIRLSSQKFLIKQVNKATLYDNNRTTTVLLQLQMWLQAYYDRHIVSFFLADLRFAFQDYQYLYMVYDKIEGYTLDTVFKHHVFTQEETKYVVAVLIQLMEFFHERKYALTQLSPEHLIVEKETGKIKLLQIFSPMSIDHPYHYNNITNPSIYSAPQVLAKNKVLAESDYYTLGTMMYQMMTHKNIMQEESSHQEIVERHHIMAQQIEIKKYNLPQGWNPEAADFLVKLLIKNPQYRLGRYGSFQLRFHPWLQNYNWEILPTRSGISLNEQHLRKHQVKKFPKGNNIAQGPWTKTLLHDPLFLRFFQKYTYKKRISTSKDSVWVDQARSGRKSKGKRSEKYYDNKRQESDISDQEEDDYCEDLDIQSEQIGKSQQESKHSIVKTGGKGLLNIVEKGY